MSTILSRAQLLYNRVTNRVHHVQDLLFKLLPYRPIRVCRENWEREYESHDWDCLKGIGELAHYSVIVGYCEYFDKLGAVLDVGCGEGILQERLRRCEYSRYVGIDISAEAIRRASRRQDETTRFVQADVATYEPDQRFDTIIFNECMYYLEDPLAVLRKFEAALTDGGLFIVSMHETERSRRLWKTLESVHVVEDEVIVTNHSRVSWAIKVLNPRGAARETC
jgi:2-polyprenyl-3-methyl-5-hydroxy-6-metoxy-1,4-benzoquinol methylase